MDALMARYLDGTLSDDEADALLNALTYDPRLEADMKAFEDLLAAAAELPAPAAPANFTDDVMERLAADVRPAGPVPPLPRERGRRSFDSMKLLATAATVILIATAAFQAGRIVPTGDGIPADLVPTSGSGMVMPVSLGGDASASAHGLRLVRFAHVPARTGVGSVSVAGSFNDWSPTAAPMTREGNAWVTYLLLPPDWHEYMFVEDGSAWVTDPSALRTVNDGFGNENAVLDIAL